MNLIILETYKLCSFKEKLQFLHWLSLFAKQQGGMEHWDVNYTSPQSFTIITFRLLNNLSLTIIEF